MNVFVLTTGRAGSTTFIRACRHAGNYTASHESRISFIGPDRLNYPPKHIEADNRLCWFLGRLEQAFGNNTFYVHLVRERAAVARSFSKRSNYGIMQAYGHGIIMPLSGRQVRAPRAPQALAFDLVDTVTANIQMFLKDKHNWLTIDIDNAQQTFPLFWERIGAEGDLKQALCEFNLKYNRSRNKSEAS